MSEDFQKLPSSSTVAPKRLPSFRRSRDLTLGALTMGKPNASGSEKSRKLFTPNLNVERKKNKEVVQVKERTRNHEHHRGRGRGERGRGRGRGRDAPVLVQAFGSVFSEGIASDKKATAKGPQKEYESANDSIPIPKLNLKHDFKVNKEEEDQKLQELLRDDFIDDPGLEPDKCMAPVELPLKAHKLAVKREIKEDTSPKKATAKLEKNEIVIDGVKIKQEFVEEEEEASVGAGAVPLASVKQERGAAVDGDLPSSQAVSQLLNWSEPQLILVQLPDCLPAFPPETRSEVNRSRARGKQQQRATENTPNEESSEEEQKFCCLRNLAAGRIGTLQIRRSGKVQLVLGQTCLNVAMGTPVGFRQNVVVTQLNSATLTGDMVDLGTVTSRLVCTPDWTTILASEDSSRRVKS